MMRNKTMLLFCILIMLLVFVFFVSLAIGSTKIKLNDFINVLLNHKNLDAESIILWKIRLPRIILGVLVGGGLAVSGCIFQAMLQNPLADPYTLGISGGSALGVSLGVILGLNSSIILSISAFLGALISILFVYLIASKKQFSTSTLILGGVILSFIFSSLVLFIFAITSTEKIHSTILWLMGDLSSQADFGLIRVITILIFAGVILIMIFSRDINLLTLGEEKATLLGVNAETIKKIIFFSASLITGACVSASGVIGFIGLLIPHFTRKITGPNHQILIPASFLSGGIFLSLCDTLARTIISPLELPVGVITGIFGGIFFLGYLMKSEKFEIL